MGLLNGGFEGALGWIFSNGASRSTTAALFGALGLDLRNTNPLTIPRGQQEFAESAGEFTVEFYAKMSAPNTGTLTFDIATSGGYGSCRVTVASTGSWTSESPTGTPYASGTVTASDWNKFTVPLVIDLATTVILRIYTDTTFGNRWFVDGVKVRDGILFTETIHAAIVSDLGDIDGTGIFTTTLGEATGDASKRWDEMKHPAAIVTSGDGEDDFETIGNKTRTATQSYTVVLGIQSDTPQAGIRALLDDVRNSLQRSTAATLTASSSSNIVRDVNCRWSLPETDEATHEGILTATVEVVVSYHYTSGGL